MPATPLVTSTRFFHRGLTKVYAVATIADLTTPTRLELDAGTDLSDEIAAMSGWLVGGAEIETPDLGSVFTSKIPGSTSVDESSITFYADDGGMDIRTVLPRGTNTHVVILHGGDTTGNKMDVFPVRVRANGKPVGVEDEAGMVEVQFSITSEPEEDVEVPV